MKEWMGGEDGSWCFFFRAEDGIRGLVRSRGVGDEYKGQQKIIVTEKDVRHMEKMRIG